MKLCARDKCWNPVKRAKNRYCSHKCAASCTPPIHLRPRRKKKAEPLTPQQEALQKAENYYAKIRRRYGVPPYWITGRKSKKGVAIQGERNPNSKLTREQAAQIKASTLHYDELAKQYGVNRTTIQKIRRGKSWASLN